MSRRKLAALGIILNMTNRETMSEFSVATGTGTVEIFFLYPYSENINPSAVEGRKLYFTATKELG